MKKVISIRLDPKTIQEIQKREKLTDFITKAVNSRLTWLKGKEEAEKKLHKFVIEKEDDREETNHATDEEVTEALNELFNRPAHR